ARERHVENALIVLTRQREPQLDDLCTGRRREARFVGEARGARSERGGAGGARGGDPRRGAEHPPREGRRGGGGRAPSRGGGRGGPGRSRVAGALPPVERRPTGVDAAASAARYVGSGTHDRRACSRGVGALKGDAPPARTTASMPTVTRPSRFRLPPDVRPSAY